MEPLTIPFQRGGMPFEAIISDKSCIVRDLTTDERFDLGYKFQIKQIIITTGENANVQVRFETGLETATGEMVNIHEGSWRFDSEHPDLAYFQQQFGQMFMGSCVNGFVKHYMKSNPKYASLTSAFEQVLDNLGNYLPENND